MIRNEVRTTKVDDQTVILIAPAATSIPRVAYLTLANRYAPEGEKAVMAEGGTGFMDWDGERRMVHEFWTVRDNPTEEDYDWDPTGSFSPASELEED